MGDETHGAESYYTLNLRDVKEGDKFYESEGGLDAVLVAIEDARLVDEPQRQGYACRVMHGDRPLELFEAHKPGGYGLRLYRFPMYGNPWEPAKAEGGQP